MPLAARSWIGDGASGATVTADGTIDWYCPDRFDAPAALSRLIDAEGGAVRVGPVRTSSKAWRQLPPAEQRYLPGTLVTATTFLGPGGATRVEDVAPWAGPGLRPDGRIVRLVTAPAGPVDVEVEVAPGDRFGPARSVATWSEGMAFGSTIVRTGSRPVPVALDRDRVLWRAGRRLEAGETMVITIDRAGDDHHGPLSPDAACRSRETTATAWRRWLGALDYDGAYRAPVERAALTLKALTWYRTGGTVAAATAGLPRLPGGERNTDDRVVPWRLPAAIAGVLGRIGFAEDAEAAEGWLRQVVQSATVPWPAASDVEGGDVPEASELAVAGWRRSQPVVIGGGPAGETADGEDLDLSTFAAVAGAVSASGRGRSDGSPPGPGPLSAAWPALVAGADWLAEHWGRPDRGRWAIGGRPRALVASRVAAWVALDTMVRTARAANPLDLDALAWYRAARDIAAWCEREGLAADGGLRMQPGPEDDADAALLQVAWTGPWPVGHPIVARTVDRVLDRLSVGGLVHRYPDTVDDGIGGGDNPDLVASLWAVRALARLERWEDAHARMEAVSSLAGPSGLLSTAADPRSGELVGNLPSAEAHVTLIEAVLALERGPS